MYSAPRAIQVAGAILAIATAGGVTSLPAAQSLSEYRPRVDQLARLWRSTSAAAARAESLQLRAVKLDTIRVAGLVVLTRSSYKQIVQEATGLPVFDYIMCVDMLFRAVVQRRFDGYL